MNRPRSWAAAWGDGAADVAAAVLGVGLAVALAGVLDWNPAVAGPAFEVSPIPGGFGEWLAVAALVVPVAAVAALDANWLACSWVPFPSLFVLYLHYYAVGSGSLVVAGLPVVAALAAVAAVLLGTSGYLVGLAVRLGHERLGPGTGGRQSG